MRMIDADAFIAKLDHVPMVQEAIRKAMDTMPTIEQPEIIRCKDCKHYDTHDHRCKVWNHGVVVMGYCSRGEKK